ncbi:hypothetical protein Droror1_Dr00000129 [Drosera rotundifolia]
MGGHSERTRDAMTWPRENETAFIGILYERLKKVKLQCSTFTKDEWGKINEELKANASRDYGIESLPHLESSSSFTNTFDFSLENPYHFSSPPPGIIATNYHRLVTLSFGGQIPAEEELDARRARVSFMNGFIHVISVSDHANLVVVIVPDERSSASENKERRFLDFGGKNIISLVRQWNF